MARQCYDAVTVDLQHSLVDYQTALGMLQAIEYARCAGTLPSLFERE